MELLIIRGKKDGGKSTTAAQVHNELIKKKALLRHLKLPGNWIQVGKAAQDFITVYEYMRKVIAIISAGDDADSLNKIMESIIGEYHPDVLVVCARTRNSYTYSMLEEKYPALIKQENIFETEFIDFDKLTYYKSPVMIKIINRIEQILKTI